MRARAAHASAGTPAAWRRRPRCPVRPSTAHRLPHEDNRQHSPPSPANQRDAGVSPWRRARRPAGVPVHEPRWFRSDRRGSGRYSCQTHPLRQNVNSGFSPTPKGPESVRDRYTTCEAKAMFIISSSGRGAPVHLRGSGHVAKGMGWTCGPSDYGKIAEGVGGGKARTSRGGDVRQAR